MRVGIIAYGKSPGEKKIDKYAKKMSERRVPLIYLKKAWRNTAFFLSAGEENAEMYFRKAQS
jgi:hypothetical protein